MKAKQNTCIRVGAKGAYLLTECLSYENVSSDQDIYAISSKNETKTSEL